MVEHQPSKLVTWVRFPSPALAIIPVNSVFTGVFLCQNSCIILHYPNTARILAISFSGIPASYIGADLFLTGDKDFLESSVTDPRIISVSDFLMMQ